MFHADHGDHTVTPEQINLLHELLLMYGDVEPRNIHYFMKSRKTRDKKKQSAPANVPKFHFSPLEDGSLRNNYLI